MLYIRLPLQNTMEKQVYHEEHRPYDEEDQVLVTVK